MADNKFTIPKTATEAKKSLVAGEQIIALKQWEKAAVIAAYAEAAFQAVNDRRAADKAAGEKLGGYAQRTVSQYRAIWADAHPDSPAPVPGDEVVIPDKPWTVISGGWDHMRPKVENAEHIAKRLFTNDDLGKAVLEQFETMQPEAREEWVEAMFDSAPNAFSQIKEYTPKGDDTTSTTDEPLARDWWGQILTQALTASTEISTLRGVIDAAKSDEPDSVHVDKMDEILDRFEMNLQLIRMVVHREDSVEIPDEEAQKAEVVDQIDAFLNGLLGDAGQ